MPAIKPDITAIMDAPRAEIRGLSLPQGTFRIRAWVAYLRISRMTIVRDMQRKGIVPLRVGIFPYLSAEQVAQMLTTTRENHHEPT